MAEVRDCREAQDPMDGTAEKKAEPGGGEPLKLPDPRAVSPSPKRLGMSLNDLLKLARAKDEAGMSKFKIIEWLRSVAEIFGIRVAHDLWAAKPAPQPQVRKGKRLVVPILIQQAWDGSGTILLNPAEAPPEQFALRAILSYNRRGVLPRFAEKTHFADGFPLVSECNGAVVDVNTWKAISRPPRAINATPNNAEVNQGLAEGKYDIIQVDDGTIVTIYGWKHPAGEPLWGLSTCNGYDVSSLRWMGDKTFAEVVYEALQIYPEFVAKTGVGLQRSGEDTRLTFARLDRRHCYTIGFRHHDFHPLRADPERVWQVQTVDLTTGESSYSAGLPGIPWQTTVEIDSEPAARKPGGEKPPPGQHPTVEKLNGRLTNALEIAKKFIVEHKAPAAHPGAPPRPPELRYGFILRSRAPGATRENSDILIESDLLRKVRSMLYERPPKYFQAEVSHGDRLELNALMVYLGPAENRESFTTLLPHWGKRFNMYEGYVGNVVRRILQFSRQRAEGTYEEALAKRGSTSILASALLDCISETNTLNPYNPLAESIVKDFIMQQDYAVLFLRAMQKKKPAAAS